MPLRYQASVLAVIAGLWSGGALAQDAVATQASVKEPDQQGIADIIVTAQRRTENLQGTAVAVDVLSGSELVNRGVNQPQELEKIVPALRVVAGSDGGVTTVIRGVGGFSGNPFGEPGVAFNLDGVYLPRNGGPNALFYDLERVEVLKGPQGTLYGRNATAGAINVITRQPERDFGVEGTLELGNYNLRRGILAVNTPLGDNAALRIAGTISRRNGYFSDGYGDDGTDAVRGTFKFQPTSATTITLTADYQHVNEKGNGSAISPFLNPSDPFIGFTRDGTNELLRNVSLAITGGANPNLLPAVKADGFVRIKNWGVSGTIVHDFGGVELTVIPSYRDSESHVHHYGAMFPVTTDEYSAAQSLEVRLASTGELTLSWLVGGYYFNENLHFDQLVEQGVANIDTVPRLNTQAYAAFGNLTVSLSDRFRLVGGLRYNEEHKSMDGVNGGPLPPVPTGFAGTATAFYNVACASYDLSRALCYQPLQGKLNQNKVTWKAGIEWDAAPKSLIYANVGTGFKAGGFFGSLAPNTYQPEILTAYTVGSKNRFFDNTLQLNAEAFYWDYKDKQVTHTGPVLPSGFSLITENAGKAEIYGGELNVVFEPTRNNQFTADVQYLHAEYKNFVYTQNTITGSPITGCRTSPISGQPAVLVDCSGLPMAKSPKWTVNLSYNHRFDLSDEDTLDAMIGTRIESGYWLGEEYIAGEYQGGSMMSNASLVWRRQDGRFSLGAYIENIENEVVKTTGFVNSVIGMVAVNLRSPRTYGIRAGFKF